MDNKKAQINTEKDIRILETEFANENVPKEEIVHTEEGVQNFINTGSTVGKVIENESDNKKKD